MTVYWLLNYVSLFTWVIIWIKLFCIRRKRQFLLLPVRTCKLCFHDIFFGRYNEKLQKKSFKMLQDQYLEILAADTCRISKNLLDNGVIYFALSFFFSSNTTEEIWSFSYNLKELKQRWYSIISKYIYLQVCTANSE